MEAVSDKWTKETIRAVEGETGAIVISRRTLEPRGTEAVCFYKCFSRWNAVYIWFIMNIASMWMPCPAVFKLLCKYGTGNSRCRLSFRLCWALHAKPLKLSWPLVSRCVCVCMREKYKGLKESQRDKERTGEEYCSSPSIISQQRSHAVGENNSPDTAQGGCLPEIDMKTEGEWMIQTAAAKYAASAALWAPKDSCSHRRLASRSFTTPYLFYSPLLLCIRSPP